MSFTRKFLKALGIEDDKVETIMEEHTTVTEALKKDRDTYKADADKLADVQKQLNDLEKQSGDDKGWKQKYDDLVAENQKKETAAAKTAAFRKLLKEAGVSDKYLDTVIRASAADIDKLELDGDTVKDADKLTETQKKAWSDFIPATTTKTDKTETPPKGDPVKKTKEEILAIKDRTERREAIAENMDLFS